MKKTMLVVGSAPCLYADIEAALQRRPFASVMLINGACTAVENAEHVLAGHEEKAEFFAAARREKFPNASPWRLHACTFPHRRDVHAKLTPSVTDWHPFEMGVAATSASKGAKIALGPMGFDEVILCGCPMNGGGYFEGEAIVPHDLACKRVGSEDLLTGKKGSGTTAVITPHHAGEYTTPAGTPMKTQETKIIRTYRANLIKLAAGEFKGKVFSMSGFTRQHLGLPEDFT